jgi:hypothetical protein
MSPVAARRTPTPEWFWERFSLALGAQLSSVEDPLWKGWTACAKTAAATACAELDPAAIVRGQPGTSEERTEWLCPHRGRLITSSGVDVSVRVPGRARRAIAFESEGGKPPRSIAADFEKTWLEEFAKLCCVDAELRVLCAFFARDGHDLVEDQVRSACARFAAAVASAVPGEMLLLFGPYDSRLEPRTPWRALALTLGCPDAEATLRALPSSFRPQDYLSR